jgi:hypothetical protein
MAPHYYKGNSLRNKVFIGFMIVCFFSIIGSTAMSYLVIQKSAEEQSKTDQQGKFEALMKTLDYAVSQTNVTEGTALTKILQKRIYEISDINKHDVILYDLKGNYLVSNKEIHQISQKKIPSIKKGFRLFIM